MATQYKILYNKYIDKLEEEVQTLLDKGWKLHGAPVLVSDKLIQVLIK